MTTTEPTIDALEAKAAKAQAAFEAALAAAAEARQQELDRQAERARQIHEETVATYSRAAHDEAIENAKQEFTQAVADSRLGRAWVDLQLAELRAAYAAADASSAANALGRPPIPPRPASNAFGDLLATTVDRVAADELAQELAARDAERAAYIAGTTQETNR